MAIKARIRIKRRLKVWGTNLLGVGCLLLAPLVAPLPGPGGTPLILAGLYLLSINNPWIKRFRKRLENDLGGLSDLVFIDNRLCRAGWDALVYLSLAAGGLAFVWIGSLQLGSFDLGAVEIKHNLILQTLLLMALYFPVMAWFRNRYRWRRLVKFCGIRISKHWPAGKLPAKAVTLHQPWASLVAKGAKTVETRSWRPPASLIGRRIAIHAGRERRNEAPGEEFETAVAKHLGAGWRDELPAGAVVATAVLAEVAEAAGDGKDAPTREEALFGDYRAGRWMWRLGGVKEVKPPVPVRGHRRIWSLEPANKKAPEAKRSGKK